MVLHVGTGEVVRLWAGTVTVVLRVKHRGHAQGAAVRPKATKRAECLSPPISRNEAIAVLGF